MSATKNLNLGSSQRQIKRRRLFFVRFYIIIFFLLLIIFSLAILSGHEKVKIQTILITGNASASVDNILEIARRDLTGRYLYLFSKSNSLIFPRFRIKSDILREIKTIKDLDVSWVNWQTIFIEVIERKPFSVWCGDDIKINNSVCYFIDKEGYIYSQAPTFSGSVYVKNYGVPVLAENQASTTDPLGLYFLPKSVYSQIFGLIGALDQNNLKVVQVYFDGVDYRFILEIGPTIIFNNKNNFNLSFNNLFSAIETKNLDLVNGANLISYIDLRYDNKIVIGKKGEQLPI